MSGASAFLCGCPCQITLPSEASIFNRAPQHGQSSSISSRSLRCEAMEECYAVPRAKSNHGAVPAGYRSEPTDAADQDGRANCSHLLRCVLGPFFAFLYFQQHGPLRFQVRSGSFFPQLRVFNNFSASVSGSLSATPVAFPFVFSNFSGSFLKKGILFCFSHPKIG